MRTVNATFEDSDFKKLEKSKIKSGLNWPSFIIKLQGLIEENELLKKKLEDCEKRQKI